MELSLKSHLAAYVAGTLLTLLAILFFSSHMTQASAPPGLQATVATSSNPVIVANTATVLIATSSCAARIISTASTTLMLTFNDAQTPTGTFGVYQAASTTVAYDSGQYGCGQVKGFGNGGGFVTVIDSR